MSARLALRRRRRRRRRSSLLGSLLVGAWPVSRCEVPLSRSISQIEQKMWWSVWSVKLVLRRFWWPAVDLRRISNRFCNSRKTKIPESAPKTCDFSCVKLFQSVNLKSEVWALHISQPCFPEKCSNADLQIDSIDGVREFCPIGATVTHVTVRSITFRQTAVARVRASRAPPSSSSSGRERDRLHTTTSNDHKQRERRR